jgi:predicted RNA-binding Zn-ribbon protein involved in translation (DUF1610 family)
MSGRVTGWIIEHPTANMTAHGECHCGEHLTAVLRCPGYDGDEFQCPKCGRHWRFELTLTLEQV